MSSVKNSMIEIIGRQPDDRSYEEILRELADAHVGQTGRMAEELADTECRFRQLADQWRRQCAVISSVSEMSMLEPYQRIIGMGNRVIPLILEDLSREPDHWFWALQAITGEDPIAPEHAGNIDSMAQDWLRWGRDHGYI